VIFWLSTKIPFGWNLGLISGKILFVRNAGEKYKYNLLKKFQTQNLIYEFMLHLNIQKLSGKLHYKRGVDFGQKSLISLIAFRGKANKRNDNVSCYRILRMNVKFFNFRL
jgi:hypothetical protein